MTEEEGAEGARGVALFARAHAAWREQRHTETASIGLAAAGHFENAGDAARTDRANALLLVARAQLALKAFATAEQVAGEARMILVRAEGQSSATCILSSQACALEATAFEHLGRYERAAEGYAQALRAAQSTGDPALTAWAAALAGVFAKGQGDYDHAEGMYAICSRALADVEPPDQLSLAGLDHNLGGLAHARGEAGHALGFALRALERRKRAAPAELTSIGLEHNAISAILIDLGRLSDAERHLVRARELLTRGLGSDHVELGYVHHNLAELAARQADWPRAERHWQAALDLKQAHFGDSHLELAVTVWGLASAAIAQGEQSAGGEYAERVVALLRGSSHPLRAAAERLLAYPG